MSDERLKAKLLKIIDNYVMPYGKYKGKRIKAIPDNYVTWLAANSKDAIQSFSLQLYCEELDLKLVDGEDEMYS